MNYMQDRGIFILKELNVISGRMDEWLDQLEFHNNRYSNRTDEIGFRDAIKMYLLSIVQRRGGLSCFLFYFLSGKSGVWKHKGLAIIFSRITPAGSSLSDVRAFPRIPTKNLIKRQFSCLISPAIVQCLC